MGKPEPKEKLADTKNRILGVAEDLFSEKGYDSTGIDEIARGVGIAKSVIYYHFKNKEEILGTIIESFFKEIIQLKLEKAREFLADPNMLRELALKDMLSFMTSKKKTIRILFMESIKRKQDIPLLSLWDINNQKWVKDFDFFMSKLDKEELSNLLLDSFFFGGNINTGNIKWALALSHTVFNVANTIIFLPFIHYFHSVLFKKDLKRPRCYAA